MFMLIINGLIHSAGRLCWRGPRNPIDAPAASSEKRQTSIQMALRFTRVDRHAHKPRQTPVRFTHKCEVYLIGLSGHFKQRLSIYFIEVYKNYRIQLDE